MTNARTVSDAMTIISRVIANLDTANRDEVLRQISSKFTTTNNSVLYFERAVLLGNLATVHPAGIADGADPKEPGRSLLMMYLDGRRGGQVSWHIDPAHREVLDHVAEMDPREPFMRWDGHDKDKALRRVRISSEMRTSRGVEHG